MLLYLFVLLLQGYWRESKRQNKENIGITVICFENPEGQPKKVLFNIIEQICM